MSDPEQPPLSGEQRGLREQQRWDYEQSRAIAEREHDRLDDFFHRMNETAISASHVALRTLLLMNGGAAIALLSYDGRLPAVQAKAAAGTLLWFALGVVTTAVAMALTYFTHLAMAAMLSSKTRSYQRPFVSDSPRTAQLLRWKIVCHWLAAIAATVALALFVIGVLAVRDALLK